MSNKAKKAWLDMTRRCKDAKWHIDNPCYSSTTHCEEWDEFKKFEEWFGVNYKEGMCLEKDILSGGENKYCPEFCVYIPRQINNLVLVSPTKVHDLPLGVTFQKTKKGNKPYPRPYTAQVNVNGKVKYLGMYETANEAHKAWQQEKASVIEYMVDWWQFDPSVNHSFDQRVAMKLFDIAGKLRDDCLNDRITETIL